MTHATMDIICLCCFPEFSMVPAMNHASMHGNSRIEDFLNQRRPIRLPHRRDSTLGQGEVDGLGEVQRHSSRISEV